MERVLLIRPQDVSEENVFPLLRRGEELRARWPEGFDGWYLIGLCSYRLGRTGDALRALTRAYGIRPEPLVGDLVRDLGGDVGRARYYEFRQAIRDSRGVLPAAGLFILSLAAVIGAAR